MEGEHLERPRLTDENSPVSYFRRMLEFRRQTEPDFSIKKSVSGLRRVSPALVSLILKGERRVTVDRVEELARLMKLTAAEKFAFRNWIAAQEEQDKQELLSRTAAAAEVNETDRALPGSPAPRLPNSPKTRAIKAEIHPLAKKASLNLLNDWLNIYIKDLLSIRRYQKSPKLLQVTLKELASPKRIERAINFLHREGYILRRPDGTWAPDSPLAVAEPSDPQTKVRKLHKAALSIASRSLELFGPSERYANMLTVALSPSGHEELRRLLADFAEQLKDFATKQQSDGERLYQVVLNLSPIGSGDENSDKK